MTLAPGMRLGPYEITGALGAGGMGEVYRAKDTNLNRNVALKILPDSFAADADRVARFKREAQLLASLNHPNIAAIYGLESNALVMELVEGEDLSAHIARSPLDLADALPIVRQIIDALEAAHEQGIVHRDLKPQNIKVREDGTTKVLDFGLAKALAPEAPSATADSQNSPTLTARATQMGVILGTASYMSPEQARGRAVDKRTDVWALGCVLYEMLSGAKAFGGDDATEIISSVVKSEPDWNALPATVPPHVRQIVERCLAKDRKARIPDVSVVRYMLDGVIPLTGKADAAHSARVSRRFAWAWPAASALLLLTTLVAGVAWYRARSIETAQMRFTIDPPAGTLFTAGNNVGATAPVISPDGRSVAFTAQDGTGKRLLYVRPSDSLAAQPLPGTDGAGFPFWSPDSRFIGYSITGKLLKVAATGGTPKTLCTLNPGITSRGGSWNREDVIIFNNGPAPLYRVPATGGTAAVIGTLAGGQTGRQFPWFLPDGRQFLFHATGPGETSGLFIGSLDSNDTTRLTASDSGAAYDTETKRLLFVREGTLVAQAFDFGTRTLSGDPIPVAERVEAAIVAGVVAFSISETGVLTYGIGNPAAAGLRLAWVSREGKALGTLSQPAAYRGISLSPNGSMVVAHRHDGEGGDLWLTEVGRNATTRFTFDPAQDNSSPIWSPTGDRIAFQSIRNGKPGVSVKASNSAGTEERVFEAASSRFALPLSWSPDGKTLVVGVAETDTNRDLWMVSLDGPPKATAWLKTTAAEMHGQFSPDGRWLVYSSNETGPTEIYVMSAKGMPGKWPISTSGGQVPRWSGDSREVFYVADGKLWAVPIGAKGDALVPGLPKALFPHRGIPNANHPSYFTSYDVSRDGQRFLLSRRESEDTSDPAAAPIVVVFNWRSALTKPSGVQ